MNLMLKVKHTDSGKPAVQKVLTKEEAYPGANNEQAPDLTLVMTDYSFISILDTTPCLGPRRHMNRLVCILCPG